MPGRRRAVVLQQLHKATAGSHLMGVLDEQIRYPTNASTVRCFEKQCSRVRLIRRVVGESEAVTSLQRFRHSFRTVLANRIANTADQEGSLSCAVVCDGRRLSEQHAVALSLSAAAAEYVDPGRFGRKPEPAHVLRIVRSLSVHHAEVEKWPETIRLIDVFEIWEPDERTESFDGISDSF